MLKSTCCARSGVMGEVGQDQVDLVRRQQRDAVGRVGRQHLQPDAQLCRPGPGSISTSRPSICLLLASTKPNGGLLSKDATRNTPALRMSSRRSAWARPEIRGRGRGR